MAKEKKPPYRIIEHGGPEHAALLGLVAVGDSYELADPTPYIQTDPTGRLESIVTRQRVAELQGGFPKLQSTDPLKPNYAPPIWRPTDE